MPSPSLAASVQALLRVLKQRRRFLQQLLQKTFSLIHKMPHNLCRRGLLVVDFMNAAVVERQNLSLGISEQNRRMARNNELRVFDVSLTRRGSALKRQAAVEERELPQVHPAETGRYAGI